MTHDAATAYACVAYRVMEYDREPLTEEQFEVILEMLFGFYNEREIEKIYQQNIVFGSNDAIINEEKIKKTRIVLPESGNTIHINKRRILKKTVMQT